MGELNNRKLSLNDKRFIISFNKKEPDSHWYCLNFTNNCEEEIKILTVEIAEASYHDVLEATFIDKSYKKTFEKISAGDRILIGEVNEYNNRVDEFLFTFTIPKDNEILRFTYSIERKELVSKFPSLDRTPFSETIFPCVEMISV